MRLGGTYAKSRMLATGKTVYVRLQRGQLIACKWPKKRPRVTHPTTLDQMERFRQANWLAKYAPAPIQMAHRRLVDGTQLLPRDLMVAAMLGRGMWPQLPGELRRYPVAAIRDLSDTLDILGAQPSDLLARGPDRWLAITPQGPGQVPVSGVPGQAPQWQTLSGGGGIWTQIEDVTLAAALALGAYHQVTIPANAKELDFYLFIPATASGTRPTLRVNNLSTSIYFWAWSAINAAGALISARVSSQAAMTLLHTNLAPNLARSWTRGFLQQEAGANGAVIQARTTGGNIVSTSIDGIINTPNPTTISQLGFTSDQGQGLPIGTRVIVNAVII